MSTPPRIAPFLALLLAACSSAPSADEAAAPPPAVAPPAQVGPATLHVTSERDGFVADVTSIVYTDQFRVKIEGLRAGAEVALATRLYSPFAKGRGYMSEATYVADSAGRIDTGSSSAIRGSYEGVEPDGPVWSAKEGPLAEGLGPDRTAAFFAAKVGDDVVATASIGRTITAPDVAVEQVTDHGLVAELLLPAGTSQRVPVLAFGGSEGGIGGGESYAGRLASLGYPVLAVAYFGAAGLPADLSNVPLEYFAKAFAYLDRRPELQKGKVVVLGGSRGGELALLLGATFPNVVGVIADTPSSYRWPSVAGDDSPAWTYEGKPLAFVPSARGWPDTVTTPSGEDAWVLRSQFLKSVASATPATLEAARIRVEATRGPILMFGGGADAMWQACDFIAAARTHLDESGHSAAHQDEGVCFPDAGHAVSSLGVPPRDSMWATLGADLYALGGTAPGNAHAGRIRDGKVRAFLERVAK